ncbi:MAG: hypothetical protein LBS77_02380 [Desulfovibrio sp.]|nr:hypothetical protein [Desulfovibrio sp.]
MQQIVNNLLLAEIKKWRQANSAVAVIASRNLLDADDTTDITPAMLVAMDAVEAKFAELPVVTVNRGRPWCGFPA